MLAVAAAREIRWCCECASKRKALGVLAESDAIQARKGSVVG